MIDSGILIITEANQKVASGHLFESIVCYNELVKWIPGVFLMVNSDMPRQFKEKLPGGFYEYTSNIQEEADYLIQFIIDNNIGIIVFNLRDIENQFILKLKSNLPVYIICIDEFGHKTLNVDVIINPMIDASYWKYDSSADLYCGAEYLVLPPNITKYHEMDIKISDDIHVVTVSMGGVDAPGTTLKMVDWLPAIWNDVQLNLVIGGGFPYKNELNKIDNKHIMVYQNIDYIYDLFIKSDLVICAGGNTLHELAVIGVPTLVIPSMPHELRNGQAFQKKGFSICCNLASKITRNDFIDSLEKIKSVEVRRQMSQNAKKMADGCGYERVCSIVKKKFDDRRKIMEHG